MHDFSKTFQRAKSPRNTQGKSAIPQRHRIKILSHFPHVLRAPHASNVLATRGMAQTTHTTLKRDAAREIPIRITLCHANNQLLAPINPNAEFPRRYLPYMRVISGGCAQQQQRKGTCAVREFSVRNFSQPHDSIRFFVRACARFTALPFRRTTHTTLHIAHSVRDVCSYSHKELCRRACESRARTRFATAF